MITGATSSFGRELISRLPGDVRIVAVSRQPLPPEMCNESEIINVISDLAKTDFLNNFDNKVDLKEFKFHYKKDELGNKRETTELRLPVPSVEGVVSILETGGKGLELLLNVIADATAAQARARTT